MYTKPKINKSDVVRYKGKLYTVTDKRGDLCRIEDTFVHTGRGGWVPSYMLVKEVSKESIENKTEESVDTEAEKQYDKDNGDTNDK